MLKKIANHPLPFLIVTVILAIPFFTINTVDTSKILGAKTQIEASPSPSVSAFVTITPTPTASPSPSPEIKLSKTEYKIALYGDSMIDTMGDMSYLNTALAKKYPNVKFNLYNYGIGAQNVKVGFERINLKFSYANRNYDAIGAIGADAIVVGTFAYNPFDPHNTENYRNYLQPLISQLKATGKPVYLLIEVGPLGENFGKGPRGVNLGSDYGIAHSKKISEQLTAAKTVAQSLNIPIIDVYTLTQGNPTYTDPDDGIHPSVDGHIFTANLIVQTVVLK